MVTELLLDVGKLVGVAVFVIDNKVGGTVNSGGRVTASTEIVVVALAADSELFVSV